MADNHIPIDIHYNKLSDWLVNRRHCQHQWQGAALSVREKINTAIQDMPPVDEITQLLHGTYINYFHCERITFLLKDTEDGSKNIFGRYSSQRMKDWLDILKLYQEEGIYLAEAAQMLSRNVNYEIPALKRQITKYQQIQNDCTRKEGEYASTASELKEKYHASCRNIGIKGNKVKTELLALVKDMPTTHKTIEESIQTLRPACQYYTAFIRFMLSRETECLTLLTHILEKGNTTVYEWNHGSPPTSIVEPAGGSGISQDEATEGTEGEEIDWGDIGDDADNVDFGISLDDNGGDASHEPEGVSTDDGIDWGADGTATTIEIVDDITSIDDGIARGTDALTILDNTETRNSFINQLLELEAFLTQRACEMTDDSSVVSSIQFNAAPQEVQQDADTIQGMLGNVSKIVVHLTSKKMQDLFLIRSSPRYVDRMADSLKKILDHSEKMSSLSRLMVVQRQEAIEDEKSIQPKVDLLRKRTQELQKQIEKEISTKYKDRRVNIMGEINII